MGLLVTLTELLGRLTILTPLLERYLGANRAAAGVQALEQTQQTMAEIHAAHSELKTSLENSLKEQQARLVRIEDTVARVANRLAEMANERDNSEAELRKLRGLLRVVLAVGLAFLVAVLVAIGLLVVRGH